MNATDEASTYTVSSWLALLLSPAAWAVQMSVRYAMQPWTCAHASTLPADLVALAALLVALAAAWLGHSRLRALRERSDSPSQPEARARFMAALASWLGAMFALVIVAQWIPGHLLDACPL
jgi:hypothetical protein